MALFKPIAGYLSGKIGGIVASKNAYGQYFRQWVKPVNPQTQRQTHQRERVAGFSRMWGDDLTAEQRAGWSTLAALYTYPNRLGDAVQLTPNALFVKVNTVRVIAGDSASESAPANLSVAPLLTVEVTQCLIGDNELTFTISAALTGAERLYCFAALNVPHSRGFVKNLYRFCGVSSAAAANPIVITIPSDLGLPEAGKVCHFRLHRYDGDTGALSPGYNVSAVPA